MQQIPRTDIIPHATPVGYLRKLGAALNYPDMWIKMDSYTASPYGGNKPRKLEFLLADAIKANKREILTVGGIGSNHCLATAIYGKKLGFKVHLLLVPQPVTEHVKMSVKLFSYHGAVLHLCGSYRQVDSFVNSFLRCNSDTYYIPAGGSTPLGVLGFVNAALELKDQIHGKEIPKPDHIFLPAGTCGTLAGLILGFCLAEIPVKIHGIRVVDEGITNVETVSHLINGTLELLTASGCKSVSGFDMKSAYTLHNDYFGKGYGEATPEGEEAALMFKSLENIDLEVTYTAKAAAAMLSAVKSHAVSGPVLFWYTFAGPVFASLSRKIENSIVPNEFRRFL
ncbi:pyridoxal-phosphate dependent enzyme [bacterium]|nr:pyridoxal-phosphate dependent enzyme [candidate division CSSED10-310 bacterium]